jgi:hypothetical protein
MRWGARPGPLARLFDDEYFYDFGPWNRISRMATLLTIATRSVEPVMTSSDT